MVNELTPYNFASNNPISRNDPLGLQDTTVNGHTAKRDKDLQPVTVTSRTAVPDEFLPHLRFRNGGSYSVASSKDWPLSTSENPNNDLLVSWGQG